MVVKHASNPNACLKYLSITSPAPHLEARGRNITSVLEVNVDASENQEFHEI